MNNETPETDNHPSLQQVGSNAEFIHADFARTLERERDRVRAKLKIVMTAYAEDVGSSYEEFNDLSWD